MSTLDYEEINTRYAQKSPQALISWLYSQHQDIWISFSGAEDVVLIDMACKVVSKPKVFSLDTGRLHSETYDFIERVRSFYNIELEILSPNNEELEAFTKEKGLFSFYKDGHQECCQIRKVRPLRRKLSTVELWITGQRKDQSPTTRNQVAMIEHDLAFSTESNQLIKANPLANWTSAQVWDYIRQNQVPFNQLHENGFVSIGCQPCTRPILPNQHEREGRWWWEDSTKKECGLHSIDEK